MYVETVPIRNSPPAILLRRDRHLFEFIAGKQSVKFRFLKAA